jgi:hypothetical protein
MLKKILIVLCILLACSSYSFAQKKTKELSKIDIPEKNWSLEVSLPGFFVTGNLANRDNQSGRLDAEIESEGYMLTIMWVKTAEKGTSKELRDLASNNLKRSPVEKDGFTHSEYKEFPMLEYLVKEFRGVKLNQKHHNAYIAKDGVWIDIHLSKVNYTPGEEKRFFAILDSVKFVDTKPSEKASSSLIIR